VQKIFDYGRGIVCWLVDGEYYIYGVTLRGDPRIAHSEGAARSIAASAL
jgi:hypothetical protein